PVTQLYVSIDAPNKELMKTVDIPLFEDYWERFLLSLDYLAQKKERTCVRLTIIKGVNDIELNNYARLIERSDSDFIEVKSYMHVGESQHRLESKNMPLHEDIVEFCETLVKYLNDYEIVSEHIPSRVVMLAKKKFNVDREWMTWIDFEKWNELINSLRSGNSTGVNVEEYWKKTPSVGLSGKGTLDTVHESLKKKLLKEHGYDVAEDVEEIELD
ncbi:MAG: hypothetical protein ABIH82_03385, partial [Candidatus Woesearchaeota archaeon]